MHSLMFPTTIVDDFLHEPFQYVELAKSLEFFPDNEGKWPGTRSKNLSIDYSNMVNHIAKKIFSLYYNFIFEGVQWRVDSYFQKVSSIYSKGWIHNDEVQLTSIIYFCNSGFGTTLYRPNDVSKFKGIINGDKKRESHLNTNNLEQFKIFKDENNNQFYKSISVDSKFNRLFCFEGGNYHGVDNFENKNSSERLTLILFLSKINPNFKFPIQRSAFLYE